MKATYELIKSEADHSFGCRRLALPSFSGPFHYHPELELTYIESSSGKRYVGSHVSGYGAGDLVLIGANTPHCWKSDDPGVGDQERARATVIQFREDFPGGAFFNLPEMKPVRSLFARANAGLVIRSETRKQIVEKMESAHQAGPFQRLIMLLEMLHLIAGSETVNPIDIRFASFTLPLAETERFRKVFSFLIEHYTDDVSLTTISDEAHLTPTSFCRFFKSMTQKTLKQVLIEFRINHACQLLVSTNKAVSEICFESGFGNISHFSKTFREVTGKSPLQYRKQF